ncbi:MAG TPA: TraM recognition domain-containing protein [Patescibacteria group bacterium]|nr:TraM recognition domain-containing protein [Patescibacteria group bacterium]
MDIELGFKTTPGGDVPFFINPHLHTWLLGKSGTGKSTAMLAGIVGAMRTHQGLAVEDPHGDLIDQALQYVPLDRLKDVVLIDLQSPKLPGVGYFDGKNKELSLQNFMSNIEARAGKGWGPRTAEILRGAADAVLDAYKAPTILDVYKVLSRKWFADSLMRQSKNPLVQDFYTRWFSKQVSAKDRMEAFSHPLNKIDELMRPGVREIVAQKKSLRWDRLMDERKIVFIRLPKGEIGTNPAKIIGALCLMNINLAAPRRKKRRNQFTVFVDEIHNFLDGIDFEMMLAELRKYGVNFFFATQTTAQMRDEDRKIWNDEIAFGNCSTVISFRVGGKDSEKIALNCADEDGAPSLVRLANYNFYAWTLRDGLPVLEGPVTTYPAPEKRGDEVPVQKALAWARENTGTKRSIVEADIENRLRR